MKYEDETLEKRLKDLKNHERVTEQDSEKIEEFYQEIYLDENIGNERIYKYLTTLKTLFSTPDDKLEENIIPEEVELKTAEKEDMKEVAARIKKSDYSDWSKSDFKVTLKKFYNTVWNDEFDRPKRIKKILAADYLKKPSNIENKRDIEALTPSDVKSMAEEATNKRDKLLPILMFETGARIGEIQGREVKGYEAEGIKLKDVELKQKYADVEVETLKNEKKGSKTLQLVRSVGLLQDWLEDHPRKDDPEAHLFVSLGRIHPGKKLGQARIAEILRELADKAEVDKPIRNHVFRHSSATYKGTELGWNPQRMMYWHGSSDPDWAKNYCHQDEDRMKSARLEEEGIEDEENSADDALELTECPRCADKVDPFASYCPSCSLALDRDAAQKSKDAETEVRDDVIQEIKEELGWSDQKLEELIREKTREHG